VYADWSVRSAASSSCAPTRARSRSAGGPANADRASRGVSFSDQNARMLRAEKPIVLCIDVEPDPRVFDPAVPAPWDGFERLLRRLPALRERLSEASGRPAAFTWNLRMDPQVEETFGSPAWLAERYGETFAEFTASGDELGLHTHVWRLDAERGTWIADFEDPSWGEYCAEMALDAFESSFGRPCRAHRGGDRFLNGAMLSVLERRGVTVDLTVEPGRPPQDLVEGEAARGRMPDYTSVPGRPYRTSPGRFPAADRGARNGPLIIPLMSVRRRRPPFRRVHLPPWETSRAWRRSYFRDTPIVAFAIRTDFILDEDLWGRIEANFERLARFPGMSFETASSAAETQAGSLPSST
jgi:hypothetical protein